MNHNILSQTEDYVLDLFNKKLPEGHFYHNMIHTRMVVSFVKEIAEAQNFTEKEQLLLQLASWFHDVGHIEKNKGHEAISATIAKGFLSEKGFSTMVVYGMKEKILTNGTTRMVADFS